VRLRAAAPAGNIPAASTNSRPSLARLAMPLGAVVVALLAAGCGGGGSPSASNTTVKSAATTSTTAVATGNQETTTTRPGGPGGAALTPAAQGSIASISGDTLEVQDQASQSQTSVDVTARTRISATLAIKSSAVKVGTCILVTGTKGAAGAVDATTISVEPSVKGQCALGTRGSFTGAPGPGGGGGGFRRFPGTTGSGSPSRRPTFPTNTATAVGKVTAISGTTLTVHGFSFSFRAASSSGTTTPSTSAAPKLKMQNFSVHVSASTKYDKTASLKVGALKVGECATAFGTTNNIGIVTATRLSITQPTAQGCVATGGFRFGGGGGFPGGGTGRGSGAFPGGSTAGSGGAPAGTTP